MDLLGKYVISRKHGTGLLNYTRGSLIFGVLFKVDLHFGERLAGFRAWCQSQRPVARSISLPSDSETESSVAVLKTVWGGGGVQNAGPLYHAMFR